MSFGHLVKSTIGKKAIMAFTGLYALLFVVVHLLGNLEIFMGPDAMNAYAVLLRQFPKLIWGFRLSLIVAIGLHIWLSLSLTQANRQARPVGYLHKKSRKATLTSRTMMLSGLMVLCFILYHLAHYTLGITNPEYNALIDAQGRHHVYNMVVMGFQQPLVAGFYILAQILLACHLSHGIASATRTLGVASPKVMTWLQRAGMGFAAIVAFLYISIPVSVLFGFLKLQ